MAERQAIEFDIADINVRSLADGAPRVTLDLFEKDMDKAAMLWAAKLQGLRLRVCVSLRDGETETDKRSTRHPFAMGGG